jgi:hypothetical protein
MVDDSPWKRARPVHGGEMGAGLGAKWSQTPLGVSHNWPDNLTTLVDLMLASELPMMLLWGASRIQFYNDSFREFLGDKHPAALGDIADASSWPKTPADATAAADDHQRWPTGRLAP